MYRTLDDGIELVADDGQARVRLRAPQRPFADEFLDFLVELEDSGLNAATGVRTIEGDGLPSWTRILADAYTAGTVHGRGNDLSETLASTRGTTDVDTSL